MVTMRQMEITDGNYAGHGEREAKNYKHKTGQESVKARNINNGDYGTDGNYAGHGEREAKKYKHNTEMN